MSGIVVRPARPEEFDALARIWWQGINAPDGSAATEAQYEELQARIPREVAQTGWTVFAGELDGRLAGFLALDEPKGELREIFIETALRSRGVGKALLDFSKTRMARFWLRTHITNLRGHKFYEREGLKFLRIEPHPQHPEAMFRIYGWPA